MKTLIEVVDRLAPMGIAFWLIMDMITYPDHALIAIAGIGGWLCYVHERRHSLLLTIQLAHLLREIRKTNA